MHNFVDVGDNIADAGDNLGVEVVIMLVLHEVVEVVVELVIREVLAGVDELVAFQPIRLRTRGTTLSACGLVRARSIESTIRTSWSRPVCV